MSKVPKAVNGKIYLGSTVMGTDRMQTVVDLEQDGATIWFNPPDIHPKQVKGFPLTIIGMAQCRVWTDVLERMLHESMEWALMRIRCRYVRAEDQADSTAAFYFMASHEEFTEACAIAAVYVGAIEKQVMQIFLTEKRKQQKKSK